MSFNKANVVMLPTDQKTNGMICKDITGQDKIIAIKTKYLMEHEDYVGHHLYIISDDEIKEGDYCYSNKTNKIIKATCDVSIETNNNIGFWKKIIATTDESLNNLPEKPNFSSYMSFSLGNPLPQPSQQFIQKYIEEYNRGNIITDVLVEYENKFDGKEYVDELDAYGYDKFNSILKINSKDNTITIKIVKDCYTREEVDRLLDEQASKTTAEMLEKFKGYKSKDEVIDLIVRAVSESHDWSSENNNIHSIGLIEKRFLNKWIEENL